MRNVQAIISNISFPKTLDDLRWVVYDHGCFNVEDIIFDAPDTIWTVPNWITVGDVVFFMHAKTAIQRITHLETELQDQKIYDRGKLKEALRRAREIYKLYGGKIYAVGRVSCNPYYENDSEDEKYRPHWKGRLFAEIGDICILDRPVPISEFSGFIRISRQSAITPVLRNDFTRLKDLIASQNEIPDFLKDSVATPMPLKEINAENWMSLTREYRRTFKLEMQFRKFYVDYFLRQMGDRKIFYTECRCYQNGEQSGFADYGIRLNKQICFVEVKLNFSAEKDLKGQLKKYCQVEKAELSKEREATAEEIIQDYVLVIDTEQFGIYNAKTDGITILADLDDIRTAENVGILRQQVIDYIF